MRLRHPGCYPLIDATSSTRRTIEKKSSLSRSANRNRNAPTNRKTNNGFRLTSIWQQDVHPVPAEFENLLLDLVSACRAPAHFGEPFAD